MKTIEKIRNLPESKKKIIFWTAVIILGIGLLFWWGESLPRRLKGFQMADLKLPEFFKEIYAK